MDGEEVRQEHGRRGGSQRDGSSRREVVNWILGLGAGGVAAAVFYPIVRYIVPPEEAQSAANSVALSVKPEDVKPNSGQIFKFGNKPAILIRTPSGDLRAFTAVCTHLDCIVQYRPRPAPDLVCLPQRALQPEGDERPVRRRVRSRSTSSSSRVTRSS